MCPSESLETLSGHLPAYVRLPRKGDREFYTGLSTTALNRLVLPSKENNFKPPVISKLVLIGRNQSGGTRLVNLQLLLRYIESQQTAASANEKQLHETR